MKTLVLTSAPLALALFVSSTHAQTLIGDNQADLSFGSNCPSTDGSDTCPLKIDAGWQAPDPTHAINVLHANIIRLPFLIERAQPSALGDLDTSANGYMNAIKQVATTALNGGAVVVFDPHNFGFVYGNELVTATGQAAYLDFEKRFSIWIVQNFTAAQIAHIGNGLMNEPHQHANADYQPIFQQAINLNRASGSPA